MRRRFLFTVFTAIATILLMSWGAFVTSIDAGLAVPDWPTSFNSYDPFNPWPEWWTMTPVLAEHGHRLLGALVGLLTLVLGVWTVRADDRRWMRWLGVAAVALVILQGVLGGLRVVWISMNLAVVHACVAQIFFGTLVAMAVFTSQSWSASQSAWTESTRSKDLSRLAVAAAVAVFVQVILGALLRHPGTGIDMMFAALHIFWAFVVVALILATAQRISVAVHGSAASQWRNAIVGILAFQFALGMTAFFVLLDERGLVQRSNLQVIVNSSHMVVGALLFGATIGLAVTILRRPRRESTQPTSSTVLGTVSVS